MAVDIQNIPLVTTALLGSPTVIQLTNPVSGSLVNGVSLTSALETTTPGGEDSSLTIQLLSAGAAVNYVKFSGKTGQYPIEVLQENGGGVSAIGFTAGFDSEIVRTGTKNLGFGTTGSGANYMYSNNVFGLVVQGNGTVSDVTLGSNVALANNATNGFAHMPCCETTGVMTGVPSFTTGFFNHHAPFCFNTADNTINVYNKPNGAAWKRSVALL